MAKVGLMLASGCEEIEALTVVDLLRRAGITIDMVSITDQKQVTGAHDITITADRLLAEVDWSAYDGVILPGGMPGTTHLKESAGVCQVVKDFFSKGKLVAAICAAPTVLGACGILQGKRATCYPGCEDGLTGAVLAEDSVVVDGNVLTSRGMGTAIDFGLAIISYLMDATTAEKLAKAIVYR